jgi:predicted house-cleaning NTP pyrophosphatase (Maf/HAM1 superfamily)
VFDKFLNLVSNEEQISDDDAILITSDQVIVWNGQIREKPRDANECREFLRSYQHSPAEAVDAVVVTILKTGLYVHNVLSSLLCFFFEIMSTFNC